MLSRIKIFVLVMLLFFATIGHAENIKIDLKKGRANITADGVGIKNAYPKIQLLVGENKELLDWLPEGIPETAVTNIETPLGTGKSTTLTWAHANGYLLTWCITEIAGANSFTIEVNFRNNSKNNVLVRRIFNLSANIGNVSFSTPTKEWMVSSRYLKYHKYYDSLSTYIRDGQLYADNAEKGYRRDAYFEEDLCFYTNMGKTGLSISAVGDIAYQEAYLHVLENGKIGLDVTSDMSGVLVEPGEMRNSEKILFQAQPWHEAGQNISKWLLSVFKPRNSPPVFGWCSWYSVGSNVSEEHCYKTSAYIKENWNRYPMEVLQIDDGWQVGRHCWFANGKFGKGMGALADDFVQTGSMAGIWVTTISPTTQMIKDGDLVNDYGREGKIVRSFDPSWYVNYRKGNPSNGNLDPSSPGAKEYILSFLNTLYDQGYRYFKTDFSQVSRVEAGYADPKMTSYQIQRFHYSLIRKAIGDNSYLLACNGGPIRAVLGLADATRIGTDTGTRSGFCSSDLVKGKPKNVHGAWFPIVQCGAISGQTGLIACDPDVTRLDNVGNANYDPRYKGRNPKDSTQPMPVYLDYGSVKAFHGIQGLFGGTMMVSDLFYNEGYHQNNRMRMLEIMQPVTSERGWNFAGGFDLLNKQFGFICSRPWGQSICMNVWNPDHTKKQDLFIDNAPVDKIGNRFHLWSFWDEKYLGIQDKNYCFRNVSVYNSYLIRLTPIDTEEKPTFIGSNLHMAIGTEEIKQIVATVEGVDVDLVPTAGAIEGQLVFYSEKPLVLANASGCNAFVMESDKNVYTLVLTERNRKQAQTISLRVSTEKAITQNEVRKDDSLNKKWMLGTMTILK